MPINKELKLTKPSIMELRSLTRSVNAVGRGPLYCAAISTPNIRSWPIAVLDPKRTLTELKAAICTTIDYGILSTIIVRCVT